MSRERREGKTLIDREEEIHLKIQKRKEKIRDGDERKWVRHTVEKGERWRKSEKERGMSVCVGVFVCGCVRIC